jgi:ATP-binding cassette subfamily C protein CydD
MRPIDPRLLRYASAARSYLVLTVGLGLVVTTLVLLQAGLLAHLIAGATAGSVPSLAALASLLGVVAARGMAAYGGEVAALRAAATVKSQLRRRLVSQAMRLGPSWLASQRSGELTTLTTRGLDALDPYFARYLPQLVLACLTPLAVLAVVGGADWPSALVIAVTLPLIPIFLILVGLHSKARSQRQWELLARLGGHFLDVVEGLPTLKVFNRAKAQVEVIRRISDAHRAATMHTLRSAFLSALVLELFATLSTALVAVEIGLRLLAANLSYETALFVLLLAPEAYLPLRAVGAQFHASMEGVTAAQDAFAVLDTEPSRRTEGAVGAQEIDPLRMDIRFERVGLRYPGRHRPALQQVWLDIAAGERVAIVGPSGAGKSSLLTLLLRFTEPTCGRILVGGVDLGEVDVTAWRRRLAWVPQRPHLFAATVADNIRLGDPSAGLCAVRRAARAANAEEFIDGLPHGYQTPLGENGLRLSAGQRQRIAIARAVLRDAPLLLLDEPTAHLDAANAATVRLAVERLMADRTVLIVTHSAGWARTADRVITVHGGQVREIAAPAPQSGLARAQ